VFAAAGGRLTLEKQVPAAAGLGGGSSDAAAAWRLGRAWDGRPDLPATPAELNALASLGADVPFFAAQLPVARVSGIGERVVAMEAPNPPLEVILVHPGFQLPTAAVFAELRPTDWQSARQPAGKAAWKPAAVSAQGHSGRDGAAMPARNQLLAAALRLRPELAELLRLMAAAGGDPQLTGSGPTIYCFEEDVERADRLALHLRQRLERADARVTRTRTRLRAASIRAVQEDQS
jgi:4-diphosphocytidyl-2-C-methyl-D-erythritol kinase